LNTKYVADSLNVLLFREHLLATYCRGVQTLRWWTPIYCKVSPNCHMGAIYQYTGCSSVFPHAYVHT